ncbi:TPA: hypothetical protein DEB00_00510 [Candidatus Uhrbacteria bacterium]|nr:hypothetical protein [Candidatus Uhrbacteria bacterium]
MHEMAVTVRRRIDSRETVMKNFTPPQLDMFREAAALEASVLNLSRAQFQGVLGHKRLRGMLRDLLVELGQERPPNADEARVRLWDHFLGVSDTRKVFGDLISDNMVRELGDVPDALLARVKASQSSGEMPHLRLFLDPGLSIDVMVQVRGVNYRSTYGDMMLASTNQPCWRLMDVRRLHNQSARRILTMELMGLLSKGISQTGELKQLQLVRKDTAGHTVYMTSRQEVQGHKVQIIGSVRPSQEMTITVPLIRPSNQECRHATPEEIRSAYNREIALESVTLPDGRRFFSTRIDGVVVLVSEITWIK